MKLFPIIALSCLVAGAAPYRIASESEITARVSEAKKHLSSTEGGQLLWASIKAHGGLDKWFSNGLLKFRWIYNMEDRGAVVDTTQTVDTWSSRAVHTVNGSDVSFGWTGTEAWVRPEGTEMMPPPSFWALTPYYFVGVPHVLADPGTVHEKLPSQIIHEGVAYDQVKVTYAAGTGETPDDYYIVLIHPENKRVKGVRYIVTDQRITGGKPATPEKLITYEGWYEMSGVLFPKKHLTFNMTGDTIGEKIRFAEVKESSFLGDVPLSFHPPVSEK